MSVHNKTILISLFCAFLYGCASTYKPTANVLELSRSMSKTDAVNVVRRALVTQVESTGVCGGSGLPSKAKLHPGWEMDEKNPELDITEKGFSVNAYRRVPTTTVSGSVSAPIASTTFNLTQPFRHTINFADVEYVRVFNEKGLEYRVCYVRDGQSGVMMGLATGFGDFYGVVIDKRNLEQFIAAMMILSPQAVLETGS